MDVLTPDHLERLINLYRSDTGSIVLQIAEHVAQQRELEKTAKHYRAILATKHHTPAQLEQHARLWRRAHDLNKLILQEFTQLLQNLSQHHPVHP